MVLVYPNTTATFSGNRQTALNAGYVEVSDEIYADLVDQKKIWQDGEIVSNPDYAEVKAERDAKEQHQQTLNQINVLKQQLADTDYMAIKHSEGWISDADYASVKALRQSYRDMINELEATLSED